MVLQPAQRQLPFLRVTTGLGSSESAGLRVGQKLGRRLMQGCSSGVGCSRADAQGSNECLINNVKKRREGGGQTVLSCEQCFFQALAFHFRGCCWGPRP